MEECDDQKTEMLEPIFPRNVIELEVGEIQWKCDRVRSRSNGSGSIWRGQGRRESHMSGKVPQSPLCGTHHTYTWIMDIWDNMDKDQINVTDMDQTITRAGVYWKDNSIDRKRSPHVRESPTISALRHSSNLQLLGTTQK